MLQRGRLEVGSWFAGVRWAERNWHSPFPIRAKPFEFESLEANFRSEIHDKLNLARPIEQFDPKSLRLFETFGKGKRLSNNAIR